MTKIVHIEIPVDDTEKSRAFWGGLFGWQFEPAPGAPDYHMTRIDESSGAAISAEPGKRGPRTYFDVEDINASVARVKELGGEAGEPMPVPSMGWFATCKDDQGNEFGLWQTDPNAPTPEM
jgi:predicted enzyme related to lactoylglutathione lyase